MQNKIVVISNFVAILTHGYVKIKIKIKKYCNFDCWYSPCLYIFLKK